MKKRLVALLTTAFIAISSIPVFAGTWEHKTGLSGRIYWKYKQDDGTYVNNGWKYIDGDWYYFCNNSIWTDETVYTKSEETGLSDLTKPKYYVGADGRMIKNGWYKENNDYSWFVDTDGRIVEGWFMVDGDLYKVADATEYSGISRSIITTWSGKTNEKYIDKNGNTKQIQIEKVNGKVVSYGNLLNDIKYVPQYNSQGQLIGAIQN